MAALSDFKITGKVLVQIGDNEPIEVGTIEVPVQVSAGTPAPATRGEQRQRDHQGGQKPAGVRVEPRTQAPGAPPSAPRR